MKIRRIEIAPQKTYALPNERNPLIARVWIQTSDAADIQMSLNEEASAKLIECMARELVAASINAAEQMTVSMLNALCQPEAGGAAPPSGLLSEQAS